DRTTVIFLGFALGLPPMAVGFTIVKAFSALGRTKWLMFSTIFNVITNAVLDAIFAHFWQGFGIALATSVMYLCTTLILLFILRHMIGKLDLFTPPIEVVRMMHSIKNSSILHQRILRVVIIVGVFAVGVFGVFLNAIYALRVSLGSILILAALRYRYALLMTWVMLDAFIGSTLSFFNGNNFDT